MRVTAEQSGARQREIRVNGKDYAWPRQKVAVICLDGCSKDYIEAAVAARVVPNLERLIQTGASLLARSVVPSLTNPNNISIVTGQPPSVHGIVGNYFYDPVSRTEVMTNDPSFMWVDTILKIFHDAGAKVAVVTAKDKLRRLLGKGLDLTSGRAVVFSSEFAGSANRAEHGIDNVLDLVGLPQPDVYSAALSEFVFAAGVRLSETFAPDLMYLSTTDYVQHKAAPGTAAANAFLAMVDRYVGALDEKGYVIGLTADHGMNAKHAATGKPNILYLQGWFDARLGPGAARVVLPITDPYVVHHGALGSFAFVHLPSDADSRALSEELARVDGIALTMTREEACNAFELPANRIGDLAVVATLDFTLGSSEQRHDLSGLDVPLRSHGGLTEQFVPLILNRPIAAGMHRPWRNFDVFELALMSASLS